MDVIAAIRDIVIILYLLAGIVFVLAMILFAYLMYRALKGLVNTVTRTAENIEKVSETAKEHIVAPLEEGISMASLAGNALGFATGFIAGMRGRKAEKGDADGGDGLIDKAKRFIPFL
jgi:hypothetical protein